MTTLKLVKYVLDAIDCQLMNPKNVGGGSLFKETYRFKAKSQSMKNDLALELKRI